MRMSMAKEELTIRRKAACQECRRQRRRQIELETKQSEAHEISNGQAFIQRVGSNCTSYDTKAKRAAIFLVGKHKHRADAGGHFVPDLRHHYSNRQVRCNLNEKYIIKGQTLQLSLDKVAGGGDSAVFLTVTHEPLTRIGLYCILCKLHVSFYSFVCHCQGQYAAALSEILFCTLNFSSSFAIDCLCAGIYISASSLALFT